MNRSLKNAIALLLILLFVLGSLSGCTTLQQAPAPSGQDAPDAVSDDIVILFTNDVHCGIEDDIGYAGLAAYKEAMEQDTPYVSLVDCGDAVQGDFIGTVSDGAHLVDIMNELDYDMAVLGNHEFDYGIQQLSALIDKADYPYLACNISYSGSGDNLLADVKPYEIVTYGNIDVAFIGVATPESITKSTPTHFMENGEYVYSFKGSSEGEELYTCVQTYVDECRGRGAEYVVVLSHLGDLEESSPFTSIELINETTGIDAVLDGHAHSTIPCQIEQNEAGEDVLLSSAGTKLNNIGQLVITENGTVTVGVISDYAIKDADFEAYYTALKASYEEEMNAVVATSDTALSGYTADDVRLVRNRETTIGNFCADAYRAITGADVAFVNGGGVRADLPAGDITYADVLALHPFGNTICMVKASGQEILDCLEVAYMYTRTEISEDGQAVGENGSFQHVSGLKLIIDTSVASAVIFDENGMLLSIGGQRRVRDVYILDDKGEYVPLDSDGEYNVASHNHLIKDCGGGINVFADNEFVIEEGSSDYQVLITYITDYLGGKLGDNYSDIEGRIIVE